MPESQQEHSARRDFLSHGLAALGSAALAGAPAAPADAQPSPERTGQADPAGRFAGKAVLITGATSGIGEATARAFAMAGAKVYFCGRREEQGRKVEREILALGGKAIFRRADVRDEKQVKAFVDGCASEYGRIDVAFNNAGTDKPPAPLAQMSVEAFDDQIATNLRGVFLSMKFEIPHLLKTRGSLINMGSIGGRHAFKNIVAYGASKAAVIHMTRAAAQEYGELIRVNAVAPGAIETPMLERVRREWKVTNEQLASAYPIKRVGTAEETAAVVLWLASPTASYVSGQVIGVDGGDLA